MHQTGAWGCTGYGEGVHWHESAGYLQCEVDIRKIKSLNEHLDEVSFLCYN